MTQPKPRGLLSGATIRDTLIGVLRPLFKKHKHLIRRLSPRRPTACFSFRGKGMTRRSPACGPFASPSNPRNDLHLARGSLRPAGQSPPRSRVADLPSSGSLISASLEGSPRDPRPRKTHLRLARGQRTCPRAGGQFPPRSRPSLGTRDKRPRRPTVRRTRALKASHSATAQGTGAVNPPFPQ